MSKSVASLSKMWLKVCNLERSLFPGLRQVMGALTSKEEKLIRILDFAQIERFVSSVVITNPPKCREEIARSFIAKQVYNFQTTRALLDRLHSDRVLGMICGWRHAGEIPSESTFSRVFAELSQMKIAEKAHERFIETYLRDLIFFYHSADATAIELREKPVKKEPKPKKAKRRRGRPKKGEVVAPKDPTVLERQQSMKRVDEMLSLIPTSCDVGTKRNAKGYKSSWIGGKLHIGAVDGDIPVSAFYSSASVHDSSLALPVMHTSSVRVNYLYDLQDAAYDAGIIREYSKDYGHRPIIDINPKNSVSLKEKIAAQKEEQKLLRQLNLPVSSDEYHYNQRSSIERINGNLKDNYGCRNIYYQGATKVASVLSFALLCICIEQSVKLLT
jgi:hypothetical protein